MLVGGARVVKVMYALKVINCKIKVACGKQYIQGASLNGNFGIIC